MEKVLVGEKASFEQWHRRLGHLFEWIVRSIIVKNKLPIVQQNKSYSISSSCQLGKSNKLPFGLSTFILSTPLELVRFDLWGPARLHLLMDFAFIITSSMILANFHGFTY